MEKDTITSTGEIAQEVFDYNPSFLREEFSCTLGPLFHWLNLGRLIHLNTSKPMKKQDITKKLSQIDSSNVNTEDLLSLQPWYAGKGIIRAVVSFGKKEEYCLCSYFEL